MSAQRVSSAFGINPSNQWDRLPLPHTATWHRKANVLLTRVRVRLCHAQDDTHESVQQWARSAVTSNVIPHFTIRRIFKTKHNLELNL